MEKLTGTIPRHCLDRIQRTLNESEVRPSRQDIVDENYKNFSKYVQEKLILGQAEHFQFKAKKEAERQEREKYFDRLVEEERQHKEQEKREILKQSKDKVLQQNIRVREFNRELKAMKIQEDNKVLAANWQKKRETEHLMKLNEEMNPCYNDADQRIKNEICQRKKNMRVLAEAGAEEVREKKEFAEMKRGLKEMETRKIMLRDAQEQKEDREKQAEQKERNRQFIQQNIQKPRPPKKELHAKSREEEEKFMRIQNECHLMNMKAEQNKAEKIKLSQTKTEIVSDHLAEINKEEASKIALRERRRKRIIAYQSAKEKQQKQEESEKKAAMKKLHVDSLDKQMQEKREVKRTEKQIGKKWLKESFEKDKMDIIEEKQKRLQARRDTVQCAKFNLVNAAEKISCQQKLKEKVQEEERRITHKLSTPPEPVKQYIESELHKAGQSGLDAQYIKKKMALQLEPIYTTESSLPPRFCEHSPKRVTNQARQMKLEQEEMNSHFLLPEKKPHYLTPLTTPEGPETTTTPDLFRGGSKHWSTLPQIKPLGIQNNSQAKEEPQTNKEQKTLQIITKDLIRTIRIPQSDCSRESIVLSSSEFRRIVTESQTAFKQEKEALKQAYKKEKEEKTKVAEVRKHQLLDIEVSCKQNQKLTDLELEAQKRAQLIIDRARELKMEQEDEVKRLNQLILGAQCQAKWENQVQEKNLIQAQLDDEGKRLDIMMEVERSRVLEDTKKIDELRKQQRIKGQQQICSQIQERMEEKQIQEVMKEVEKEQIHKDQERMILEDLKAKEKKRREYQLLEEESMRINAEVVKAKERRLEEEKLADMRTMEYLQKKLEREAKYEAEQQQIKKEKEVEIDRLRAQQKRAKDHKAEQDEIRAQRNQEIIDRQWRMKQRELAAKKACEEATLKAARFEQVKNKHHCLMLEANREKAVLESVLRTQQEAMAKEKELKEKQLQKALRHAETLRLQIKERELSALNKRREKFKEADRLIEEDRRRRMLLSEVKEKKLKELKATGISEKYCSEVERKVRKTLVYSNGVKS